MPDEFPYDVFLSHSAKDKAVVSPLAERLRADGVKVWFDEWVRPKDEMRRMKAESELLPSSFILHPLHEQGLERSRVLVLCMSANAFGSDWAQLESGTFRTGQRPFRDPLNKERRFLPLRLDDTPIKGLPGAIPLHQLASESGETEGRQTLQGLISSHQRMPKAKTSSKKTPSECSLRFESAKVDSLFEVLDAIAWLSAPDIKQISQFANVDPRTAGKLLKNSVSIGVTDCLERVMHFDEGWN